ncbi:hypothetical protein G6F43_011576 [Rhizopus delemar]|nr:hypothetical protein G6F43_011576 [Rhizopus delemar]
MIITILRASPALQLLLVLLLSCTSVLAQIGLYSVILNSPDTDAAVVVGDHIYRLFPSEKSSILLQVKAPSGMPYYYAKLRKGTTDIIDKERFVRAPLTRQWTFNEFYNRNWNTKDVQSFKSISGITERHHRAEDDQLHPVGEIATIHVMANPEDLKMIHDKFLDDYDIKANVTHISSTEVRHFTNCDFGISGRTSRYSTKLPYKIKIPKHGSSLNGFRKFKLRSTQNDPSYMREYLSIEAIRAVNQPATRASFVRVFLNQKAVGILLLVEKYDSTWLEKEFNPQKNASYSNGILYEGHGGLNDDVRSDLSYRGDNFEAYSDTTYEIAEKPKTGEENSYADLVKFTAFIRDQQLLQKTGDTEHIVSSVSEWEKWIDVEGFLANMAIEFFFGFCDGYTQNTNNYYLYKDPYQKRFVYIPWDFDYNLGNGPFDMEAILTGNYKQYGRLSDLPLTSAILGVPAYRELFERQLDLVATGMVDEKSSIPVIDSLADFLRDDIAWDQTLPHVRAGPNYLTGAIQAFFEGKIEDAAIGPYSMDYLRIPDYVIRLNKNIDFNVAIDGLTGHPSLLGVKEWFRLKAANYYARLAYIRPPEKAAGAHLN